MSIVLTDEEIAELVIEPKIVDLSSLRLRHRRSSDEHDLEFIGEKGSRFRIILRRHRRYHHNFSVGLSVVVAKAGLAIRLRRYNWNHVHTNTLEGNAVDGYHIHFATERYQEAGLPHDGYAEATDRYSTYHGAVRCLLQDCGFRDPKDVTAPMLPFWSQVVGDENS